ncbi:ImmA/IrrE family metallo-endopeptidase [Candidatus Magnetaquicoccus inordinatus]|uniref:ImmA/IrrE family metallo-endopeptidase n=1 Tax=Candidatus Magnetaquicoccus inordinatus TaxID=2496818 RepID=UPI00102ABE41|nr:ImmA/IrrE family metallo-endopeptidase [Candidatus Magnetaquicoccus inordinatus]
MSSDSVMDPQPFGGTSKQIEQFAEQIAERLGYRPGDDLIPLVQRLGGRIEYQELQELERDDGSIRVNGSRDFVIKLASFTGPMRDRFTIAHELGHFFLHSLFGQVRILMKRSRSANSILEWEANWFAAGFLMPETLFRDKCMEYSNKIVDVAAFFLVSEDAVRVRMKKLQIG